MKKVAKTEEELLVSSVDNLKDPVAGQRKDI